GVSDTDSTEKDRYHDKQNANRVGYGVSSDLLRRCFESRTESGARRPAHQTTFGHSGPGYRWSGRFLQSCKEPSERGRVQQSGGSRAGNGRTVEDRKSVV